MTLHTGERQVAPATAGIRRDHVARYEWAAQLLPPNCAVLDAACGCGYGAAILAGNANRAVVAIDNDLDALEYARTHYPNEMINYRMFDLASNARLKVAADATVCFETIEHLADPAPFLRALRGSRLLASVPNQTVYPFAKQAGHFRHYTKAEFEALLTSCGWRIDRWYTQDSPTAEVREGDNGWTLIVDASRGQT